MKKPIASRDKVRAEILALARKTLAEGRSFTLDTDDPLTVELICDVAAEFDAGFVRSGKGPPWFVRLHFERAGEWT